MWGELLQVEMKDQIRSGEAGRVGGDVPFNMGDDANPSAKASWALGVIRLAHIEFDLSVEPRFSAVLSA